MTSLLARKFAAALTSVGLILGVLALSAAYAPTAQAAAPPMQQRDASQVTADALPTAQMDGVGWTQLVVGNRVFVGGKFSNARPAGAAAGVNTVARSNFLAYNITTGVLDPSFAPSFNNQVYAMALSPNGQTLYVGGQFTTVNGITRNRIAAIDVASGQVVASFKPNFDYIVRSIVVTDTTVYVGGQFQGVNGQSRSRLAAVRVSDGALTSWAPVADYQVLGMVLSPDKSRVIIAGGFGTVNGVTAPGSASVDATTGALLPWAANKTIINYGSSSAITSLKTDGNLVYGTGYTFGPGTLEGSFAADPYTGDIISMQTCRGDTYDNYPAATVLYTVSHAHDCSSVGAFPNSDPWAINMRHAIAFTKNATGTTSEGFPAPSMLNWFPNFQPGSFTGQAQAAWSVSGNSQYVVMAGEFPTVNGTRQQGLVRFAVPGIAPSKIAPTYGGATWPVSAQSVTAGSARITFPSNSDPDDLNLNYSIVRDGNTASPVYTTTAQSTYWSRPTLGFIDKGLAPGSTHTYRVYVSDANGNSKMSDPVSVTVTGQAAASPYADVITAQGATSYWRFEEPNGTTAYDSIGLNDGVSGAGVVQGQSGALLSETATKSYDLSGTDAGSVHTTNPATAPDAFSVSAWFNTSSTSGGKIIGYGDAGTTGQSSNYDRHVYLDNEGRVFFGVHPGGVRTVNSAAGFNDGQWHQVVATLDASGMSLYIDGERVALRTDTTSGQPFVGRWHIGGDNLGGWPNQPSSNYLDGQLDEVAVFPTALSTAQVVAQYQASGRTVVVPTAPADAYGAAVWNDSPDLYWRLGESSGSKAADSGPYKNAGNYQGGTTLGQSGAIPGLANTAVQFDGQNGQVVATNPTANPTTYSAEAWVKTTTTSGGKIIGFGNNPSGSSSAYDRHVYMQDDGRIVFGTWTGQTNTITSPVALNDGAYHHIVATQDQVSGMALYVDGVLVGSNPQTAAQAYDGYWRIGGDNTWGSSSANLAGTIDEVAVYSRALSGSQVANHYSLGTTGTPANAVPVASFASSVTGLSVAVDGSGSTDSDGQVVSYAWDFGDGASATGATASHAYAAAGTFTVTLVVTDNAGATGTVSKSVTVAPVPNVAPVASFASSVMGLSVAVDGSGSTDSDGQVVSYAWDFGDGASATGATASHAYAAAGTFTVTLVVTDNAGATGTVSKSVTVAPVPNVAPVASFASSVTGLSVAVDGSGSTDSDGQVVSYAWDFGDGASATGATASHAYAAAGTFTVTLVVTDNTGATGTASKSVVVTAPQPAGFVLDQFERTVTGGLGTAQTGGAWALENGASQYSVASGAMTLTHSAVGTTIGASLPAKAINTDVTLDLSSNKIASGGGYYLSVLARKVGTTDYRVKVNVRSDGTVALFLIRTVGNTATTIRSAVVPGLTVAANEQITIRLQALGTGTTTLNAKVWKVGTPQPTAWMVTGTDTTPALQVAGSVGVQSYVSGSSNNVPIAVRIDNLSATSPA